MGKPTPGFEVVVIDDDARILGPARKATSPSGCVRAPRWGCSPATGTTQATAAAFRGDFYDTGDRAYVDEDGYFWFVGRADDVITSAAYRIGPSRSSRPWSSTRRSPRRRWSASPTRCAARSSRPTSCWPRPPGLDALVAELQEHCRTVTAAYKYRARSSSPPSCPKPSPARSAASSSASGSCTAAAEHPREPGPQAPHDAKPTIGGVELRGDGLRQQPRYRGVNAGGRICRQRRSEPRGNANWPIQAEDLNPDPCIEDPAMAPTTKPRVARRFNG